MSTTETLYLKNGTSVEGNILKWKKNKVKFLTSSGKELTIFKPKKQILMVMINPNKEQKQMGTVELQYVPKPTPNEPYRVNYEQPSPPQNIASVEVGQKYFSAWDYNNHTNYKHNIWEITDIINGFVTLEKHKTGELMYPSVSDMLSIKNWVLVEGEEPKENSESEDEVSERVSRSAEKYIKETQNKGNKIKVYK